MANSRIKNHDPAAVGFDEELDEPETEPCQSVTVGDHNLLEVSAHCGVQ